MKTFQYLLLPAITGLATMTLSVMGQVGSSPFATPDGLVAYLYKQKDLRLNPFFQTKNRSLLDRYFGRRLADLILNDAVRSKGEVGALDFDPLYDAQDTEIKDFSIGKPVVDAARAEVTVQFLNFGKRTRIIFMLARTGSRWKITDLRYEDGRTLVSILKTT